MILAALGVAFAIACGGSSSRPSAASTLPRATQPPATADRGPAQPQADRIMAHIQYLAGDIGTRLAGSPEEQRAADYARQLLASWGYTVELQPFPATGELLRQGSVSLADGSHTYKTFPFIRSSSGSATGPLVDAGTGREEDFSSNARGAIALIQRKDVPLAQMVTRAAAAGAVGVIVENKEPGLFIGVTDEQSIPALAIDQGDGETLRDMIKDGVQVTVRADPAPQVTAHNVVARPPDGHCRTVSGGHYDTVPVSAGATDNASGAAMVLELARAASVAGLRSQCFVLFSGEEEGLLGSAYFIEQLTADQKTELQSMFNYDVVAGAPPPELLGNDELIQQALTLARQAGDDFLVSSLPPGTSSDFASFIAAGIPSLMFSANDQGIIHTPRDSLANVIPDPLQPIADTGFAMLQQASQNIAATPTP